ncbi:MAG: hypothetical protein KAY27_03570, partial [Pedobacter sp.]|nr:hypothetical protein [Pedobacter sp.]
MISTKPIIKMKRMSRLTRICISTMVSTFMLLPTSYAQKKPVNALEARLDNLLAKMSMQEKIEQLYYL